VEADEEERWEPPEEELESETDPDSVSEDSK